MKSPRKRPLELRLDELRAVLCLLDKGKQVVAAAELKSTQPTVSRLQKRVEEYYGAALFEDDDNRKRAKSPDDDDQKMPSFAGTQLAWRFREALDLLERRTFIPREPRPLCIAFSGVARGTLVAALKRLGAGLQVRLRETTGAEHRQLFVRGEIDAALAFDLSSDRSNDDPDVIKLSLLNQELKLVVPKALEARQNEKKADLLRGLRRSYISPSLLPRYNEQIILWLRDQPVDLLEHPYGEVRSASELFSRVALGDSYGFLPELCAYLSGPDVAFIPAEGIDYRSHLNFYYHERVKEQVAAISASLKEVCSATLPTTQAASPA